MKLEPLFSIIIPTYNSGKTIGATLKSIETSNHHYNNYEVLIIDGLSTDKTLEEVKKFNHLPLKVYSENDEGIYDAINKGVSKAGGQWVLILGSDDLLFVNLAQLEHLMESEYSLVYGDVYMPGRHTLYAGKFNKYKLCLKNICHQAIFYNMRQVPDLAFDTNQKIYADYFKNIELFSRHKAKYVRLLISIFNDLDGTSANTTSLSVWEDLSVHIKHHMGYFCLFIFLLRTSARFLLNKTISRKQL